MVTVSRPKRPKEQRWLTPLPGNEELTQFELNLLKWQLREWLLLASFSNKWSEKALWIFRGPYRDVRQELRRWSE
jgi:hypothetical protein